MALGNRKHLKMAPVLQKNPHNCPAQHVLLLPLPDGLLILDHHSPVLKILKLPIPSDPPSAVPIFHGHWRYHFLFFTSHTSQPFILPNSQATSWIYNYNHFGCNLHSSYWIHFWQCFANGNRVPYFGQVYGSSLRCHNNLARLSIDLNLRWPLRLWLELGTNGFQPMETRTWLPWLSP